MATKTRAEKQAEIDAAEAAKEVQDKNNGGSAPKGGNGAAKKDDAAPKGGVTFVSPSRRYRIRGHQFDNFRFTTDDPKVIAELKASKPFGNEFNLA